MLFILFSYHLVGMSTSSTPCSSTLCPIGGTETVGVSRVATKANVVGETDGYTIYEVQTLWADSFKQFYQFYRQMTLCDVTICVGEKSILCHRVVLASVSQYFKVRILGGGGVCLHPFGYPGTNE